jgi:uncharacterized protein (TIGR03435 family)
MEGRGGRTVGVVVLAVTVCASGAQAQVAPSFEAASIKVNRSGDERTDGLDAGNRFRMTNETLWRLIGAAYATAAPLPRYRIIGGPNWIDSDRFDVDAVTNGTTTTEQKRLMLRTLLADRFRLSAHQETREFATYDLVPARTDGRLGDKLRLSDLDCAALRAAGAPPATVTTGQPRPCIMNFGSNQLSASGMPLQNLAQMLSLYTRRVVVDKTGRLEAFDWTLEWEALGTTTSGGVSIVTALQEQLGLKLEATRGPVEVLVIDRVERPTED